ncbi:MAG: response regulator transcription factor [Verrucomicrobia bacterium]|nr:response regulator transcription factor [Verrucomicrobiota bacterium]
MTNPDQSKINSKVQILIVDDHPMTRDGIAQLINEQTDLEVCAQASTAAEALSLTAEKKPQIIVLDLTLPDRSGIELIRDLKAISTEIRILVLTMHDEEVYGERALRAGADGYLMKVEGGRKLLHAIQSVIAGEISVSTTLSSGIMRGITGRTPSKKDQVLKELSGRELEVFLLLGEGIPTRAIGVRLNVTAKTVEAHRTNIKTKLGIATASALISYAARWGNSEQLPT